ncbi:PleD family two-component system response regulator [Candidatus Omnitrophota bacterium]
METWSWSDKEQVIKKRILLIDDEVDFCYFTKKYLENTKEFDVTFESDALRSIDLAVQQKPDLILLDIMMPEMDGLAVLSRLKNNDATRSIPVIMLTAKKDVGSIAEAQSSMATDYIIKPFLPEDLLKLLKKYLGMKRKDK